MTDQHILRSANAIPNPHPLDIDELTVEQIMADRSVGQKQAYSILHDLREELYTANPVPTNQRERVLSILLRGEDVIRTSQELMVALHEEGYSINGHDSVKVLWSLQKTGHVKFRERQKPKFLYAIKLTDLGREEAERIVNGHEVPLTLPEEVRVNPEPAEHSSNLSDAATLTLTATEALDEQSEPSIFHLDDGWYPLIGGVRDRARKAAKVTQAAKLLEEVGEDDLALNVMNLTSFSPLELEIIELLERYEEN